MEKLNIGDIVLITRQKYDGVIYDSFVGEIGKITKIFKLRCMWIAKVEKNNGFCCHVILNRLIKIG